MEWKRDIENCTSMEEVRQVLNSYKRKVDVMGMVKYWESKHKGFRLFVRICSDGELILMTIDSVHIKLIEENEDRSLSEIMNQNLDRLAYIRSRHTK